MNSPAGRSAHKDRGFSAVVRYVRAMFRCCLLVLFALLATPVPAAELVFDFNKFALGSAPTGFVSAVTGQGRAGDWKIIEDQVPSALAPLTANATIPTRRVLSQLDQDPADEHFPLLIYA